MKKRVFFVFLALFLILCLTPSMAQAAETSGSCGENATWSFDEATGTLTISGTGNMVFDENASSSGDLQSRIPWGHLNIKAVVIEDGITSIVYNAFEYCSSLISVSIPDSVTYIGSEAFLNCESLTSIAIPDGVTSIDNGTFKNCTSLSSITLPDSIAQINTYAFYNCHSLTHIVLPDGVTTIGSHAFSNCSGLVNIAIPNSVTSIGYYTFWGCDSLVSVDLPDNLSKIGMELFHGCTSLTSVAIPEGVTVIDNAAFYGCEQLSNISLPSSLTSIKKSAFENCHSLTDLTIPSGVSEIGPRAFICCYNLTSISIPANISRIEDFTFAGCTKLSHVVIPNSVTVIGSAAFSETGIENIVLPDSVTTIDGSGFYGCLSLTSITIPNSVITIGSQALYGCHSLTHVSIPAGVLSIGEAAFGECNGLTKISVDGNNPNYCSDEQGALYNKAKTYLHLVPRALKGEYVLPASITDMETQALQGCHGLTAIRVEAGNPSFSSDAAGALLNKDQTTLLHVAGGFEGDYYIPATVTCIEANVFYGCRKIGGIMIPASVSIIMYGHDAFDHCEATGIWVDKNNTKYSSDSRGVLFNKEKTKLIYVPRGLSGNYCIPDGVTTIGYTAIFNCKYLTDITVPASVNYVESNFFDDCVNITRVIFKGDTPAIMGSLLRGATATVYYPSNSSSWKAYEDYYLQSKPEYFGNITWLSYDPATTGELIEESGLYYYYLNGEIQYGAGLIQQFGDYYYIRSGGYAATGSYWVSNTNGLLPEGLYSFGTDGKLILGKHGIVEEDGKLYFYIGNNLQYGSGLILWDDNYYYVRSNGQVATGQYWVTNTNGLMQEGMYTFQNDGSMVLASSGIVKVNGILYYYLDGEVQYGAGLVLLNGNYYYIRSNGSCAVGTYYVTNTNDLLEEGFYTFGEDGILIWN